jgi:hypothetical protein
MRSGHPPEAITQDAKESELIPISRFADKFGERELYRRIREAVADCDILKT